jgi:hypothetical protein
VFVAEQNTGSFGAISARDLEQLLTAVLPALFAEHLLPHTRSEFDVFVDDSIANAVQDGVARLQIAAALEAGRPSHGPESTPQVRSHIRPRQDIPPGLTRSEREQSIRYLSRMWDESRGLGSVRQPRFSSFEGWVRANGYSHYLSAAPNCGPDLDAEAWFNDELGRFARTNS